LAGEDACAIEDTQVLAFSLLGSGSSGNAVLIWSGNAKILIDNGLSGVELERRAQGIGVGLEGLDAIFITHEHGDHVRGVGVLSRRLNVPVYVTPPTRAALPLSIGVLPEVKLFDSGESVRIKDLEVGSFSISHDAVDPVSFTVKNGGARLGLAADLGQSSHLVRTRLSGCHALVLESNYCPEMLRMGDYPAQIQQRIRSSVGHLSNQDMCSLLSGLLHDALQYVVLVHISENNNCPKLVERLASGVVEGHPCKLHLATQDAPTPIFEVRV